MLLSTALHHLLTAIPPTSIPHSRWTQFLTDAERLVTERGAELGAAMSGRTAPASL